MQTLLPFIVEQKCFLVLSMAASASALANRQEDARALLEEAAKVTRLLLSAHLSLSFRSHSTKARSLIVKIKKSQHRR